MVCISETVGAVCFMCYMCLLETESIPVTKGLRVVIVIRWRRGKEAVCVSQACACECVQCASFCPNPGGLMLLVFTFISPVGIPKSLR